METGPQLKVIWQTGNQTGTSGLQGKWFIHYNVAAPECSENKWLQHAM